MIVVIIADYWQKMKNKPLLENCSSKPGIWIPFHEDWQYTHGIIKISEFDPPPHFALIWSPQGNISSISYVFFYFIILLYS